LSEGEHVPSPGSDQTDRRKGGILSRMNLVCWLLRADTESV
jgi:hypothetical protein